jgi:hypothetical protein
MASPFKFGKVVTGDNFINRRKDIKRIQNNISAGINTILISPRRWGKSSLMKQIAILKKDRKLKFAFIDFYNIRTEEEFLEKYAREVLKCSINKVEDLLQSGKEFFQNIVPSFSFGADPINDFSVRFTWNEVKKTRDEIINLPEKIAGKKGIQIVVCIDEFQNISKINENIPFEKELRSYWQHHQHTTYCLYGSRRHMMYELFKEESRAFYRFGDLFHLEKIDKSHWIKFIIKAFEKTGKQITESLVEEMICMTDNHPDYLQQLCHHTWNFTQKKVISDHVEEAMDLVVSSNAMHYQDICDSLSNTQLNLVKAILSKERKLTSMKVMNQYKLGTPRNVSKNKQVLIEKEIIELQEGKISFTDPIFAYWLEEYVSIQSNVD